MLVSQESIVFVLKDIYDNYKIQLQCKKRAIVAMKIQFSVLERVNKSKTLKKEVHAECAGPLRKALQVGIA